MNDMRYNNDLKGKSMKITLRRTVPSVCVLVCLAVAPGARATDEEEATKAEMKTEATEATPSTESTVSTEAAKPVEGTPMKFNKASGIIGMDVRNQDNEHLGHIKDLVFDLKSERVAYAVLNTSSKALLGLNDKLLAVPLSALTPSSDQKHLVLNSDKSKVEAAAGFDREHWPSATSPEWGAEAFWKSDQEKPATAEPAKPSESTPMPEMKPESDPENHPEAEPDTDSKSNEDFGDRGDEPGA